MSKNSSSGDEKDTGALDDLLNFNGDEKPAEQITEVITNVDLLGAESGEPEAKGNTDLLDFNVIEES